MPGEVRQRRISATALPDTFGDGYVKLGEDQPKQRRKSSTVLPDGVETEGRDRSFSATALALPKKVFDEVKSRRKSATVLPQGVGDGVKTRKKSVTALPDGVGEHPEGEWRMRTGSLLGYTKGGEDEVKTRKKSVTVLPVDIENEVKTRKKSVTTLPDDFQKEVKTRKKSVTTLPDDFQKEVKTRKKSVTTLPDDFQKEVKTRKKSVTTLPGDIPDEGRARAMSTTSIPEVQEEDGTPPTKSIQTKVDETQTGPQNVQLTTKHDHVRFAFVNEALDTENPDSFDVCVGPEMKPKVFGPAPDRKAKKNPSDSVHVDLGTNDEDTVVGSHPQFNRSPSTTELVGTIVKPQQPPSYGTTGTGPDNNNSPVGGFNVNSLILSIKGEESTLHMISQIIIPFLIAGFGMVGAGMVLDIVQHWDVFVKVDEVLILVPALLGLKGNLGMTLASRLSTHAHLGHLDNRKQMLKIVGGNMCLVQAQAIVVGFLAALTAMIMAFIFHGTWNTQHGLVLCAASAFTSSIPTFIQCIVMATTVILSRKYHINPDNIATPISGSFGDLVTLSLLAWFGNVIVLNMDELTWLAPFVIGLFVAVLPIWFIAAAKNEYTKKVLYNGWVPVLSAMLISSIGGLILDMGVEKYEGIAVYSPVINGIGGNLVALLASRLSSCLHQKGTPDPKCKQLIGILNPCKLFFGLGVIPRATRVLVFLTIPGHLIFFWTIVLLKGGHTDITVAFNIGYLLACLLQVILLLYVAAWMIPLIWVKGGDPDNIAIPYLTALGDMVGTGFLALSFHLLFLFGDSSVADG